jgi:hypothetical protein
MIDSRHVSNLSLHTTTVLAILGRVGCNFRHLKFYKLLLLLLFCISAYMLTNKSIWHILTKFDR